MLSVNFKNVSDAQGEIGILELFKGGGASDCPFTGYTNASKADQIQIYVNDGITADYVNYYLYFNSKSKTDTKNNYWCNSGNKIENEKKFKNGDTFWFYSKSDKPVSFSISGEVELLAVKSITINPGFNMIGSFFPAGWAVNDAPYTTEYWSKSGAAGYTNSSKADQIEVYINNGDIADYVNYYLYYNSKKETDTKNWKWCDKDNSAVSGSILTAGQGAWYYSKATSSFTLDIKNQFSK